MDSGSVFWTAGHRREAGGSHCHPPSAPSLRTRPQRTCGQLQHEGQVHVLAAVAKVGAAKVRSAHPVEEEVARPLQAPQRDGGLVGRELQGPRACKSEHGEGAGEETRESQPTGPALDRAPHAPLGTSSLSGSRKSVDPASRFSASTARCGLAEARKCWNESRSPACTGSRPRKEGLASTRPDASTTYAPRGTVDTAASISTTAWPSRWYSRKTASSASPSSPSACLLSAAARLHVTAARARSRAAATRSHRM